MYNSLSFIIYTHDFIISKDNKCFKSKAAGTAWTTASKFEDALEIQGRLVNLVLQLWFHLHQLKEFEGNLYLPLKIIWKKKSFLKIEQKKLNNKSHNYTRIFLWKMMKILDLLRYSKYLSNKYVLSICLEVPN